MLMVFYYTAARAGEVFRLIWSDINFETQMIKLQDRKTKGGKVRQRWLPMHRDLADALAWWRDNRQCEVDNVFFQEQNDTCMGKPFAHRSHFLPNLCQRAGVKKFTFHAIRHLAASKTFLSSGVNGASILLGHYNKNTTERYLKSAGLYGPNTEIVNALREDVVGEVSHSLFEAMKRAS